MRPVLAVLVLSSFACVSAPQQKCEQARFGLSFEEAKEIVARFEARHTKAAGGGALTSPKSLDDVLEILRLDDFALFKGGVQFALEQDGADARALAAQTELAWGDAQLMVSRMLNELVVRLETQARSFEQKGDTAAASAVHDQINTTRGVSEALVRLASEHLAAGRKLAKDVIDASPTAYQGYRVAADYYRLLEQWEAFDAMVAKLETLNPDSNGLLFLKGVAAFERHGDSAQAQSLLRAALAKDPKFVRAQAQLVRVQPTIRDAYVEFKKLRDMSPHHQLVVWAGQYMETAWGAYERERGVAAR